MYIPTYARPQLRRNCASSLSIHDQQTMIAAILKLSWHWIIIIIIIIQFTSFAGGAPSPVLLPLLHINGGFSTKAKAKFGGCQYAWSSCWWKTSCTTRMYKTLVNNGITYLSTMGYIIYLSDIKTYRKHWIIWKSLCWKWCDRSTASQKISHNNAPCKLSKHMVLHVMTGPNQSMCVCSATQMQLWHCGKEWSCRSCKIWQLHTCIFFVTPNSKGPNMHKNTYKHSHEKHASTSSTVSQAPSSLPLPLQTNPMVLNTQLEHFHRSTVGRCSCAGTSEGIKAIKPLRKASTFSDDMGHWLHQIWRVDKEYQGIILCLDCLVIVERLENFRTSKY